MNNAGPANSRLAALEAIAAVLDQQHSLNEIFQKDTGLSPRDQAFARHLSYGVLRWLSALDWLAARLLNKPLKRKDRDIHRLVMIGLFQLWKDETADHAAVHATAECARQLRKKWAVGLINALLRRFQREQDQMLTELASSPKHLAHPRWLLAQLEHDWPDKWSDIATENNRQAALWLRVNQGLADPETMIIEFEAQGFRAMAHPEAADAVSIEPAAGVLKIPGFREGKVSVQDPAAQLATDLMAPASGERILDACAAPGGKTCHLLERQPGIKLTSLDRDADRLELIRENLQRLGLECELQVADAGCPEDWWDGVPFNKILLDAPCSTTGVIRRHPEIKWLRDPEQVRKAVEDQRKLLDRLWPLLDTGGILVYATCSILKSENHKQIHGFLSRHADAQFVGPDGDPNQADLPGRQILPGQGGMDGFYYAIIRKSA